ncbi:MAG: hypothetical protein FJX60_23780 [Alphaproteobacteria bacterium]|nr:hypothetical protein [Alphaproteobacteria bacterium]
MTHKEKLTRLRVAVALAFSMAAAVGLYVLPSCDVCEASTSILLSGVIPGKCTIDVNSSSRAGDLPIASPGPHRVQIGSVTQNCNGRRSYALSISSANCTQSPTGGKLIEPGSGSYLPYSGEFNNPTTGGSAPVVTGLLESSCIAQIGRRVEQGVIANEVSAVYVNFIASETMASGTYQDTVTISIATN